MSIRLNSHSKNAPTDIRRTARHKVRKILRALKENPNQPKIKKRLLFWQKLKEDYGRN